MNISKKVLELDFNLLYNNLESESKSGYNKYIKYMNIPHCIESFIMYCADGISTYHQPFIFTNEIYLRDKRIRTKRPTEYNEEWILYNFDKNRVETSVYNLEKFNKQL